MRKTELPNFPPLDNWNRGNPADNGPCFRFQNFSCIGSNRLPQTSLHLKRASLLGATCLAILIAYVAALQFKIPFGIATPLSIFLMGLSISKAKRKQLLILGIIGLSFSLTLEIVFTQLFSVALP